MMMTTKISANGNFVTHVRCVTREYRFVARIALDGTGLDEGGILQTLGTNLQVLVNCKYMLTFQRLYLMNI